MLAPQSSAYVPPPIKHKPLVFDYAKDDAHDLAALSPQELWEREQALYKREREAVQREEELFSQWSKGGRVYNWPPFWPILHHNIVADVHTYYAQYTVMFAYYSWFGVFPILLFNVACMLATLQAEGKDYIPDVVLAFSFLIIGPLLTLVFYRIYYRAARKKQLAMFLTWYILAGHEFLLLILFIAAPRGSGAAGILTAYRNFDSGRNGIGTICVVQAFLWGARALCLVGVGGLSFAFCREEPFHLQPEKEGEGIPTRRTGRVQHDPSHVPEPHKDEEERGGLEEVNDHVDLDDDEDDVEVNSGIGTRLLQFISPSGWMGNRKVET